MSVTASSRRRRRTLLVFLAVTVMAGAVSRPWVDRAVQEVRLPLRHEDVIRQQAKLKRLDPALIAAVIYVESRFIDQTSHAGARGLMQILPATATFIAQRSGGSAFVVEDLATPQVNISYGSYYLRYLLDRYEGNELLALAAYNGGETNVDRWLERVRSQGRELAVSDIPFEETRSYVEKVLTAKRDYRRNYSRQLGL